MRFCLTVANNIAVTVADVVVLKQIDAAGCFIDWLTGWLAAVVVIIFS